MLNHITIHGYCGADPELTEKQGQNGTYKQVTFSVGVGRDFGDETDWFRCSMNGKRAEVIDKYFRKGSEIVVVGHLEQDEYESNGEKKRTWKMHVIDFDFCGSGKGKSEQDQPAPGFSSTDEDIPF